jgi:hypothetical protein
VREKDKKKVKNIKKEYMKSKEKHEESRERERYIYYSYTAMP